MIHFIPPSQRRLAMLAAQADSAPVLISGGSGTGKGAIAKWIHRNGARAAQTLKEASRDFSLASQIRESQGGALMIPEIGEWPLGEQKVLLTYLNTKSIPHQTDPGMKMLVNTRIIATSSHALEGRAQAGLFNPELLTKLNVFRLEMPPLTKRTAEFEDIVLGIVKEITHEFQKDYLRKLELAAWDKLKAYTWPGNLRELRNVLKLAITAAEGEMILAKDLPDFGQDKMDFRSTREEFEKIYISELLKSFNFQIDRTCQMTRLDKAALLEKIKKYGIQISPQPSPESEV